MTIENENLSEKEKKELLFVEKWLNFVDFSSLDVFAFFENITALENRFILSHMGDIKNKDVLDLGCGLGESSIYFALKGARVTAVDISPKVIELAKQLAEKYKVKINYIVSSAKDVSFKKESFDFIYCANLFHHLSLSERAKVIQNSYQFLKKGGWFYSWDPLAYNPFINFYRKIASEMRSPNERPLTFGILSEVKRAFPKVYHREFWFFTLILFFKYYLLDRYNPNKISYWKQIFREEPKKIKWWFFPLSKIDSFVLKIPPFSKLAWNILIYAQK